MKVLDKIHYRLGVLLGKRYRLWYWKKHGNDWLWGLIKASTELPAEEPKSTPISKKDFEDYIKSIT